MEDTLKYSPSNGEFDVFLFSPIRVEENGMTLSVISAYARLGIDPWAEAGRLTALPKRAAAAAIVAVVARLSGERQDDPELGERLAGLLPQSAVPGSPVKTAKTRKGMSWHTILLWAALWMLITLLGFTLNSWSHSSDAPTAEISSKLNPAVPLAK
jgi:hypothetical protein